MRYYYLTLSPRDTRLNGRRNGRLGGRPAEDIAACSRFRRLGPPNIANAPPAPPRLRLRKERAATARRKRGAFRARLTPRDNARRSPCSNILPAAHTEIEDGMRHAPAFSSQKPINMRHHGNDALRLSPRGGGPQRPACFRPVQRRAARRREWHELAADWHAIAGLATMAPLHRWALHTAASASDCETRS